MGYLASRDSAPLTEMDYRLATMYGSAIASFTVEAFSTERLEGLTLEEITSRLDAFRATRDELFRRLKLLFEGWGSEQQGAGLPNEVQR
jgi:hypothetical protein